MTRAGVGDWAEPGAREVASGIHRIPLPMRGDALRAINVYCIEDGDGIALVDGGWGIPEAREELGRALGTIGHEPSEITRIFVTHAHIDHYTMAVQLRTEFGCTVLAGRGDRGSLEWLSGAGKRHAHQAAQLAAAGAPRFAEILSRGDYSADSVAEGWETPDVYLEEGDFQVGDRAVRVLETPGHTNGHVMMLVPDEGLLFSGDQILPHITPSIGFESIPQPQPLVTFLDSLARLRTMPDTRMLPAHGPDTARTNARIDELIAHHATRLRETYDIVVDLGVATAAEVAGRLTWTRHMRSFDELDDFNGMLAVIETIAHVNYLVNAGELTATNLDSVVQYAVN